jgi:hypothetical protein
MALVMQTTQAYFLEKNPAVSSWKEEENASDLPEYFGIKVRRDFETKTVKSLAVSVCVLLCCIHTSAYVISELVRKNNAAEKVALSSLPS